MICPICGYDMLDINKAGLDLIKSFESLQLKAYKAVPTEQYYTIGYGHYGADVQPGQIITEAEADRLLDGDLLNAKRAVWKYNDYDWTPNEFAALVSFTFNVGSIDQLTAKGTRTKAQIASKMPEYNKSGGKVLAGLTRRRIAEQKLFNTK